MATKRTPLKRKTYRRVTPAAVAAFKAGDNAALREALNLMPWEFPSPLTKAERSALPPGTFGAKWWPECVALRDELEKAANDEPES